MTLSFFQFVFFLVIFLAPIISEYTNAFEAVIVHRTNPFKNKDSTAIDGDGDGASLKSV